MLWLLMTQFLVPPGHQQPLVLILWDMQVPVFLRIDINSWAHMRCDINFKSIVSENISQIQFVSTYCKNALRWMQQNPFGDKSTSGWLGAVRQQAITWANVDQDLCHHMVSLGHNMLSNLLQNNVKQHPKRFIFLQNSSVRKGYRPHHHRFLIKTRRHCFRTEHRQALHWHILNWCRQCRGMLLALEVPPDFSCVLLTLEVTQEFSRSVWIFCMMSYGHRKVVSYKPWLSKMFGRKHVFFVFSSVPADGLAPLGTKTSAHTVMTKPMSCIHMGT